MSKQTGTKKVQQLISGSLDGTTSQANTMASQGWTIVSHSIASSGQGTSHYATHQEYMSVLLEKEIPIENEQESE